MFKKKPQFSSDGDNVLLCGYLREYEYNTDQSVPQLVRHFISMYCRQYIVRKMRGYQVSVRSKETSKETCLKSTEIHSVSNECTSISEEILIKSMLHELYDDNNRLIVGLFAGNSGNSENRESFNIQIDNILKTKYDAKIINIECGINHILLLTQNGLVYSCGQNDSGQCGIGPKGIDFISTPQLIKFKDTYCKIIQIATGKLHSLFIDDLGRLLVCGYNYCGQLGIENDKNDTMDMDMWDDSDCSDFYDDNDDTDDIHTLCIYTPCINQYFVELNEKIYKIGAGLFHSVCSTEHGLCYTFGHNGFGNLGNGEMMDWGEGQWKPYKLKIEQKIIDVSCGSNHNLLLTEKNDIITFGDNSDNQCTKFCNDDKLLLPIIINKYQEFGISDNCCIEKVICLNDESLIIIHPYKRKCF